MIQIGALEAQLFRETGKLTNLSEQNIVDCARNESGYRLKCREGHEDYSYAYILRKGGIESSKKYPYTGKVSENIRKSDITMYTGCFFYNGVCNLFIH